MTQSDFIKEWNANDAILTKRGYVQIGKLIVMEESTFHDIEDGNLLPEKLEFDELSNGVFFVKASTKTVLKKKKTL